jgi:phosphatidate cytidylyltransferase
VFVTRTLAALVLAPALLYLVWLGGTPLAVTCLVLVALALWEYQRMMLGAGEVGFKIAGFGAAGAVACAVLGWLPASVAPALLPGATILVLLVALFTPEPIERSTTRAALVLLGVAYAAGLFPFLYRLREVPSLGLGLSLSALFCAWGADTGAYLTGRAIGKHKLYPVISPNKTVEGFVGGLALAIGVAFFIPHLFHYELAAPHLFAIGAIAGVLGVAGDLCESMMKRSVGAKDSSHLIPGHGGVLDRFDAVIFVAPAVYVYVTLFVI